jgi:hypothetical protein
MMHVNCLRNKITLLEIKKTENDEGFVKEQILERENSWAYIEEMFIKDRKNFGFLGNYNFSKVLGVYKIAMRKNFNRNARHAYHNALRWNHKILSIVNSFQEDPSGRWLQAVAVDCGKEAS